jgi:hypothetical protein
VAIVLAIVVVLALLIAAGWWIAQPKLEEHTHDTSTPLPLFSSRSVDGASRGSAELHVEPAEVAMLRRGQAAAAAAPLVPAYPEENGARGTAADAGTGDQHVRSAPLTPTAPRQAVTPGVPHPPPLHATVIEAAGGAGSAEAAPFVLPTAATAPPPAGTIQFLPGRLEVLHGGSVVGQEVRFIRPDRMGERPEVTLGRGEGAPYRHVQIRAPTVSRMHARLAFADGTRWTLENLSTTNPVVVNGEEIALGAPPRPLADGDRIELGEVAFRFHER